MLHFLSTLFSPAGRKSGELDRGLVETATERAIDGTDPRLRALRNYRKRLREPVETAVHHVIDLIDSLPSAVEMNRRCYSTDARLRAFFGSSDRIHEVMGGFKSLRDYLQGLTTPMPGEIYGLLTLEWNERTVLGMELHGDMIRRDVKQIAVNFSNHRFAGPASTEADTRWELKKRAFDYLVETALKKILSARGKRHELKREQQLLTRKLDAMKAGHWGFEDMFAHTQLGPVDLSELEAKISEVESELMELGTDADSLARSLEQLAGILSRPAHWLSQRTLHLHINPMGIKVEDTARQPSDRLELTELFSATGEHRIALLVRYPRAELPEPSDFFKQVSRYLDT